MTNAKIQKAGPVPRHVQHLADRVDRLAELHNRGIGVDSDTVIFERLPDGRLKAKLHPSIVSQFTF